MASIPATFTFSSIALLLTAGIATSQTLVGIKTIGGVYRFERTTGSAYQAGILSGLGNAIVQELAFDPASRTAWLTTSSSDLLAVDLTTGATSLVGAYAPSGMHGLDWDRSQSRLFGVAADGNLYTIDAATGAATLVGATGLSGTVNIAYDSARDELLAVDGSTGSLHRLDRMTGVASFISALSGPQNPGSLTYEPAADTLYLADSLSRNLYRVDPSTGLTNLVGNYGGLVALATAILPDPGSLQRPHGCGVTLRVNGLPLLGNTLGAEVPNPVYPTFIGFGLQSMTTPFCACTIGHDWIAGQFGDSASVAIPSGVTFRGVQVGIQAVQLLTPFGCPAPQVAFSDTFVFVID